MYANLVDQLVHGSNSGDVGDGAMKSIHSGTPSTARSSSHQLVLVGGLAVSARTAPRFTRDIDFCAAVADDAEAEAMIHAAQQLGYVVETAIEQVGTGRLATVRLRRGSEPIVDVRFASSGIEAEIAAAATELTARSEEATARRNQRGLTSSVLALDHRADPLRGLAGVTGA